MQLVENYPLAASLLNGGLTMKRMLVVLILMLVCRIAYASDAYFIRFRTEGRQMPSGASMIWGDDILFYNRGVAPAVVQFLGVSNGSAQGDVPTLTLPAGQPIFLNATPVAERWSPVTVQPMWVLHLEIPDGVVAESRDEYHLVVGGQPVIPISSGKVSMPIFRELVAAGRPQVQLGTDLGGHDSRANVGIYNAGADTAIATIEVRRTCDTAVVDRRTMTIPANTLVQVGGLNTASSADCPPNAAEPWARYTVITVAQPSFTLVSNLNETILPEESGVVPIVGLAVTKNEHF
jgi:hypothetical protein